MATQTRIIKIKVDTSGDVKISRLSKLMGKLNRNTKTTSKNISGLTNAFSGLVGVLSVREVARASDQFQLLRDRLKVFAGSAEEATNTFNDIVTAARLTRSSVGDLGNVFNRFKIATDGLGISNDQILATTIALQQSFRLAGSSAQEAASATLQLSQAFSLGRLQGQELRAVLLSNGVLSKILKKEFAGTGEGLKELGEQGRLTIDRVLKVILENFTSLNKQAGKLGTTFNQSLIIAFDLLKVKVDQLNQRLGISSAFAKGIIFLANNLDIVNAVIGGLAGTAIPFFLTKLASIVLSLNPVILAIGALGAAIAFLASDWQVNVLKIEKAWLEFTVGFPKTSLAIKDGLNEIKKTFEKVKTSGVSAFKFLLKKADEVKEKFTGTNFGIADAFDEFINGSERLDSNLRGLGFKVVEKESESLTKASDRIKEIDKTIEKLDKKAKKNTAAELIKRLKKNIQDLNVKSNNGAITILKELNKQFSEGSINFQEYNRQLRQIKLDELNTKMKEGTISVNDYNDGLVKLSENLSLVDSVSAGVEQGLTQVAKNAGNVAAQISQGVQNSFKTLENTIFDFVKTGEFEFKKFTQAVLDDLTRIIIRAAVIAPLSNALTSGFSSGNKTSTTTTKNAKGNAFSGGNVIPFASGGIVSRPSLFPMSGGRTGLMGEAGPEAILPLKRGAGGKLGVEASTAGVQVNIINNSGSEIEQRQRTGTDGGKILDVVIKSSVKQGLANGEFDSSFGEIYGIRRKGR